MHAEGQAAFVRLTDRQVARSEFILDAVNIKVGNKAEY